MRDYLNGFQKFARFLCFVIARALSCLVYTNYKIVKLHSKMSCVSSECGLLFEIESHTVEFNK